MGPAVGGYQGTVLRSERMRKITRELLVAHGACKDQLERFTAEWPDGLEVSAEAIPRVIALDLDVAWAAKALLTAVGWERYIKAVGWERYTKAKATAFLEAWRADEARRERMSARNAD